MTIDQPQNNDQNAPPSGNWGALRIHGPERNSFLQGQLTQDLDRLTPGAALLTGWANAKGRLLCVAWLLDWQDATWLLMPRELIAPIARRLGMFVLRARVTIDPESHPVIPVRRDALDSEVHTAFENNTANNCFKYKNGLAIFPEQTPDFALMLGITGGLRPACNAWRLAAIQAGLPTVWPATREEFVPQMVNLDLLGGISFSKGCYVGQEIVARTQNLGRIKRRMYAFSSMHPDPVYPGQAVFNSGARAGRVVDAANAKNGTTQLLAVISIADRDRKLSLDENGNSQLAPLALPYDIPVTGA